MSDLSMDDVRAVFKKVRELQAEADDYAAQRKFCKDRIKALLGGLSERALEDDSQVKLFAPPTVVPPVTGPRRPGAGEGLPSGDRT